MLKAGGVEYSEVHSAALADAIVQNIYTKYEVDKVIEAALKQFADRTSQMRDEFNASLQRFDERTHQMRDEFKVSLDEMRGQHHQMQLEMKEVRNEMDKICDKAVQRLTVNIGIIVALLTVVSTVLHLSIR
jgi:DNA anti-recombination protein RmuC